MKAMLATLRIFLGLFLLANGLNFWFHILPITPPASEAATRLMDGLVFSGLFEVVKFIEVGTGLMLLANRFVPLALAMMLPLTVVIAFVDLVLIASTQSVTFGLLLAVPQAILMLSYLRAYLPVMTMRNAPGMPGLEEVKQAVLN
jgi:putative oxidoreductase